MSLERRCSQMVNRGHKCKYSNKSQVDRLDFRQIGSSEKKHLEEDRLPLENDTPNTVANNVTF